MKFVIKKFSRVVVGLPARNEEANIGSSLRSIVAAMSKLVGPNCTLVICVNGCTDRTVDIAKSFRHAHPSIDIRIITSAEGLVNAQRAIVEQFPADVHVFPDADNVIDVDAIGLLVQELDANAEVQVAYARTIPLLTPNKPFTLAGTIGLLYDRQLLMKPRQYFHGRLFAIRHWSMPTDQEIMTRIGTNHRRRELLKYTRPGTLLSADDIYMSSDIIERCGLRAIREVRQAKCYSYTVNSFRDWWQVYRRRNIEVEKMKRWFPEYNHHWPSLDRKTNWAAWRHAPWSNQWRWLLLHSLRTVWYLRLKLELLKLLIPSYSPASQWQPILTTKQPLV